jgi:AcrR family transcriptional regulator
MTGIREQHKKKTKEAIRTAAFRLFAEQGCQKTSIEDIAREAGIGKATIYGYFSTKEDIFRDFCLNETHKILAAVKEKGASDRSLNENLIDFFMMEFRLVTQNPDLGGHLMREAVFPLSRDDNEQREFEQHYLEALKLLFYFAIDNGEICQNLDLYQVMVLFRFIFTSALSGWFKGYMNTEEEVEAFMKSQFQYVFEGIS